MTVGKTYEKGSRFFLIIALILIFIIAARTPIDTDLWWHLRAGEESIQTGIPVIKDYSSFTRFNQTWTNHSWLSQVILYLIYHVSGFTGLSLFIAVCAVLGMWIVSMQMPGKPVLKMILLVFGGIVASVNWVPRPQIISLVFLSLTAYILQRYQKRPDKWIWLMPVMFIFWGNLHGGYALGLILVGCIFAAMILSHWIGMSAFLTWQEIGRLFVVGIISYLVTAINPNGLNILTVPFKTVGVSGLQNLVSEWASPDFHEPLQMMFLIYFMLIIWLLALARKPFKIEHLITFSVFAFLAFTARRNFGPFVMVTLPMMADLVTHLQIPENGIKWIDKWKARKKSKEIPEGVRKAINFIVIGLLVCIAVIKVIYVSQSKWMDEAIQQDFPMDAVEWISQKVKPARIMSEYNWGGFIQWQLRDYPVFIDGRTDLFGDEIIDEWQDVMQCQSNTEQILEKWDVHVILVDKNRPVIDCLMQDNWQVVYQDDQAVVLIDESLVID